MADQKLVGMIRRSVSEFNAWRREHPEEPIDLRGVDFEEAYLRGADFRGANLERVNLQWADLREARLEGAILEGANLRGANLLEATFHGVNFRVANLWGVVGISPEILEEYLQNLRKSIVTASPVL